MPSLLRESLVLDHAILTDTQLNDAIAISQSSPGPLGLYVVVVGHFVAGLPGAFAGVLALATPAVLAIPISRWLLRGHAGTLQGACSGIVITSCGFMVVTGIRFAPQASISRWHAALIVIGTLVLAFTKIKPIWIIAVAAVPGLVFPERSRSPRDGRGAPPLGSEKSLVRESSIVRVSCLKLRSAELRKSSSAAPSSATYCNACS